MSLLQKLSLSALMKKGEETLFFGLAPSFFELAPSWHCHGFCRSRHCEGSRRDSQYVFYLVEEEVGIAREEADASDIAAALSPGMSQAGQGARAASYSRFPVIV